jgi:hypothetical protein
MSPVAATNQKWIASRTKETSQPPTVLEALTPIKADDFQETKRPESVTGTPEGEVEEAEMPFA